LHLDLALTPLPNPYSLSFSFSQSPLPACRNGNLTQRVVSTKHGRHGGGPLQPAPNGGRRLQPMRRGDRPLQAEAKVVGWIWPYPNGPSCKHASTSSDIFPVARPMHVSAAP